MPQRFTINDLLVEVRAKLQRLTPHEAHQAAAAGALIIDTRTPSDRVREGVIAGSVHMPRTVLEWTCDPASGYQNSVITGFAQRLIVMCNEGYSSSLAAATLQRLGFQNATDMLGGFRAWKAAGLPVQPPSRPPEAESGGREPPEPTVGQPPAYYPRRFSLRYQLYRLFSRVFQ